MKCDNKLCIYNQKGNCILHEITIDVTGVCSECIYPEIEEQVLLLSKLRTLSDLNSKL